MARLDDLVIFSAVVKQGGFSRAATHLGLSNGLISRRIAQLEAKLGVVLLKRSTRQIQLTTEGELFWQRTECIQQELDLVCNDIQALAKNPIGTIRVSAPLYFGRYFLTPIIKKFLNEFPNLKVDLILSNQKLDLIKEHLDLVLRGSGYLDQAGLIDSNLQMKPIHNERIGLYASPDYLQKQGEPITVEELSNLEIINYSESKSITHQEKWSYSYKSKRNTIGLNPRFTSNDIESSLMACVAGLGIGKFTELNVLKALQEKKLQPILKQYDWGSYHLYAIYPQQRNLPKRTRLLLDFINSQTLNGQ